MKIFSSSSLLVVLLRVSDDFEVWIPSYTDSVVARRPKLQGIPSNRKFSALFNGICCKFVSVREKITRRSFHKKLEFLGGINHCTFFIITRVTTINRNFCLLHWKIWIKTFQKSCSYWSFSVSEPKFRTNIILTLVILYLFHFVQDMMLSYFRT